MIAKAAVKTDVKASDWIESLPELKAGLRGALILPGEAAYESARRVWNGMIDRRPGAIARCAGVGDVVQAVKFARAHGVPVAVRGGGHNVAGNAVCDGGLVIDLSGMKGVRVDLDAKTAWAQAGVLWGELDRETQAFGLATTGGLVTSTGIAGFTLGGGIGWLMRSYGLACDNLLSVDVVTADGTVLRASEKENPELFWGLRGGGGNLGIATAFEFRLHPVGPTVLGGLVLHAGDRARDFLRFYSDFVARSPEALTTMFVLITAPPAPFFPKEIHGKPAVGLVLCYNGPVAEGERAVKAIREWGRPVVDLIAPMPYLALQAMFDPLNQPGSLNYWKSHYLGPLNGDAIEAIVKVSEGMRSPLSEVHVQHLQGAVAREPAGGTAFGNRDATFVLNLIAKWTEPKDTDANVRWCRTAWEAMRPFATGGVYVNFLADTTAEMVKASYGARTYERLAALKARYDPTNFFRLNHNIAPLRK